MWRSAVHVVLAFGLSACGAGAGVLPLPPPTTASPPPQMRVLSTLGQRASRDSSSPRFYDGRVHNAADSLLRALAQTRNFHLGTPQHAAPTPDGKTVLFLRSAPRDPTQSLYDLDVASGAVRQILTPDMLLAGPETLSPEERVLRERMRVRTTGFTTLVLSLDGSKALLTLSGHAYVFDRAAGKAHELPTGPAAVIGPRFSPDGTRVAYVSGDDLHVVPVAGGPSSAVTHGGSAELTHGLAEFVAAEELDRTRGFWWSPDSAHLLYEEADTSRVDVLSIADPLHPEDAPERIAYPRAGRNNAEVRFGIVAAGGGPTAWVRWDRAHYPYVAQASWPKGGPPLLYVLDRLQRTGQLLAVDPASGATKVLVEEKDDAWLNVDASAPRWLADGTGFLWSTERSGAWQLELRDAQGQLVRDLLPAGFGYVSLADVDEKQRTAVLLASSDPTRAVPWVVSLDGGAPKPLPVAGQVTAVHFGSAHQVYVSSEASLETMPKAFVRSLDGAIEREIPSVAEAPSVLPTVEMSEVGPDRIRVAIVRPRGFHPGRKYAVIDAAYGGPHFNVVEQSALAFVRAQWMADATGAVVVAIDARGTPRRGRAWERSLYKKLGSVPVEGHVEALAALGAKYHELDLQRVGVYGWSFGGYFAALAVLTRPDVYRVGVAGAPPADWRDYDTAYTERYLGLPDEDRSAYDAASLLTYARRPAGAAGAGHRLLIVHGTADDNVWFLNTIKLADALERGRRAFELMPLAGTTHMLLDPDLSEAVWTRAADVLRDALREPHPAG